MRKHSAGKTIGKEPPELKYFNKLDNLLRHLHDVGGERDRAGNRSMQMDQYCMLILLNLFKPVVATLQELQKTGELQKVQKKLACPRASLARCRNLSQCLIRIESFPFWQAIPQRTFRTLGCFWIALSWRRYPASRWLLFEIVSQPVRKL